MSKAKRKRWDRKGRPRKAGDRYPSGDLKPETATMVRQGPPPTPERMLKGFVRPVTISEGDGNRREKAEVWMQDLPIQDLGLTDRQRDAAIELHRLHAPLPGYGGGPVGNGGNTVDGAQATTAALRWAAVERRKSNLLRAAGIRHSELVRRVICDCWPVESVWIDLRYSSYRVAVDALKQSLSAVADCAFGPPMKNIA